MKAEFYIVNESFEYPEGLTKKELEDKIKYLSIDYDYIRKYKETDKIYVNPDIYTVHIYPDIKVVDFLYDKRAKSQFDRDTIEYLRIIVDKSNQSNITKEDVVDILETHDESTVYGLICLHEIEDVDGKYLVYNKHNWLEFHRYFLGLYPCNSEFCINECRKYFPNLFFHERNIDTADKILDNFSKKIIYHLSALNDNFTKYKQIPYNRNYTLKIFSIGCNLDEEASSEGNIKHKKFFRFDFKNKQGESEYIYCEPHLKLSRSDNYPGDNKYYFNRVYFNEGRENIAGGNILIGHIGEHIKFD
ncbi:MAG: hypothetical protein GY749_28245 [Desulfobacteraceae bacterium]|nr:hypothetical protein [Desulfobacteraceae bacterium]